MTYLRTKVLFPKRAKGGDVRRYIKNCFPYTISVPRDDPPPILNRPLPSGLWREVALDFKGLIAGKLGFYYHVFINTYLCYPGIVIVPNTKFELLTLRLEEV